MTREERLQMQALMQKIIKSAPDAQSLISRSPDIIVDAAFHTLAAYFRKHN